MKGTFKIFLFFSQLVSFLYAQDIPHLYKKCLPSVVKISTINQDGSASAGTGFFISEKTIVTCYHVVNNINTIDIETNDGKKFTVDSVIASNHQTDLIKFTVKERNGSWLALKNKLPEIGESVFIIGNPDEFDFSISNGIVSAIRYKNTEQMIQNTAPCSHGNSGSPVLNKDGEVVGVMSYVKFDGQNLNFAATSLNVIKMINDRSIRQLVPEAAMINNFEMDSIVGHVKELVQAREYKKALNSLLPVTKFADSTQELEFLEIIASCHFFTENYSQAAQYYELLIDRMHKITHHTSGNVISLAQALHNLSMCHFILGNKEGAIELVKQAQDICKEGLVMDTLRKEIYLLLIQQYYVSDAVYKYSEDRIFDACLSWKIAKQYGYKKDDYGWDSICK